MPYVVGRLQFLPLIIVLFFAQQVWPHSQHSFQKIFVQCGVAQGNGFNWASTLAWLSGVTEQMAQNAESYNRQHPGSTAGIDLNCFTGSSSSGFVGSVLNRLIQNPAISGDSPTKILTAPQARELSKALWLFSLSTDFDGEEAALTKDAAAFRLGMKKDGALVNVWKPSTTASRVLGIFARWLTAADLYQPSWHKLEPINLPSDLSAYHENQISKLIDDLKITSIISPIYVRNRSEMPVVKKKYGRAISILQKAQMKQARARVDQATAGTALRLNSPMTEGFCVTAFAQPEPKAVLPFNYDDLKLLYICSPKTYQRMLQSREFLEALSASEQMKNKLLLTSTIHWSKALNTTVREADLLEELYGALTGKAFQFSEVREFRRGRLQKVRGQQPYLIMGGYPGPRLQAWVARSVLHEKLRIYRQQGVSVEGRLVIFGKIETRQNPEGSFAQKTMTKYYTASQTSQTRESQQLLNRFYSFQDEFCSEGDGAVRPEFYRMDWNLSSTPAAMGDRAYLLTAKGLNLVQLQTDYTRHSHLKERNLVFDIKDKQRFVPNEGGSCLP